MTASDQSTPKRKRGGQEGNQNAVKHGFYARHLRPSEIKDLQETSISGVQEEIAMQRIVARRLVKCLEQAQGPAEVADLGKAIATVVNSLGRLIRIQNLVAGPQSEAEATFLEALEAVHRELNIDNCNPPPEEDQAAGEP
jgi:hypothetical protein